jgi:DNA-binding GntR family transcriptional regulator
MDPFLDNGRRGKGQAIELVLQELRGEILSGRLRPGARIHQQAVAERFGTSRQPVREALRELQTEGLVRVSPNLGARVACLDPEELDEVYILRERLEPLALARSVPSLTGADISELQEMCRSMERLGKVEGREDEWLRLDRSFHARASAKAESPRLLSIIESLWNVAESYRRVYLGLRPEILDLTLLEHRLLVDAFERRDKDDASRLLEMHIRRTRLGLAEHPEVFQRDRPHQ